MLTVAEPTDRRRNGYIIWKCRCDCGGEILLDTRCLQRETVRDCGCRSRLRPGQKDLTGMRFGRLVAVEPTDGRGKGGETVWKCRCDCGNEITAVSTHLTHGFKKSCGCLGRPGLKDFIGRQFGNLVVTEYAGKQDGVHRWKCVCGCGRETIVSQSNLQSGWTKSCGCLQGETFKKNLKMIDGTSVALLKRDSNHLLPSNTSGYTGVYRSRSGKWAAQITFRRKTYYLGVYENLEDAVRARRRGEEMHDDFLRWYYLEHLGADRLPEDVREKLGD